MGTPFPIQVTHDNGHTQAVLWGGGWGKKLGTLFPTQVSHYTGHTPAVLWEGGGLGLGKPFPSQAPRDTGHTQAVLLAWGVKIGDTFPNPGVP